MRVFLKEERVSERLVRNGIQFQTLMARNLKGRCSNDLVLVLM